MPTFEFKARTATGRLESGQIDAASRSAVAAQLQGRGLIVTDVQVVATPTSASSLGRWSWRANPKSVDVEIGLQQLSLMLKSGTNLLTALVALRESAPSRPARRVWTQVAEQIQLGETLSESMGSQSCFTDFTIQLVKVGEQTGHLAPVISRAAESMQSRRSIGEEVISALIYPLLVIGMSIGVTMYMIIYLIPKLEVYLQSLGKSIPPMTLFLLTGSIWLRENFVALIAAVVVFGLIPIGLYRTKEGRFLLDKAFLRVPLLGHLMRLSDTASFSRSMSSLVANGVTLTEGLGIAAKLLYNRFSATIVTSAKDQIIQGSNLANALDEPLAFTPMLTQMVAIGERSGNLEEVLRENADFHERQFLTIMRRLNALITPILTIVIGSVVGYVYIAFFMALFAAAG